MTRTDDTEKSAEVRRPARRASLFALIAFAVLAVDIVSKVLVVANIELPDEQTKHVRVLGGAIYLDVVRNSGAAFSLGTGFTAILSIIAIGVVVVIVRTASRMHSVGWAIALGLILGGALGNLTDRIFRGPGVFRGYVVDWLSLFAPDGQHWPIFNLADSAIVCGAVLAALLSLFGVSFQTARATEPDDDPGRHSGEPDEGFDGAVDGGPEPARRPSTRD